MSNIVKPATIDMPTLDEDHAITSAALSDPDALPMTAHELEKLRPFSTVKGRPRSDSTKVLVSIRYSPEVIAFFKNSGDGWQTRIDEVLRAYVRENSIHS